MTDERVLTAYHEAGHAVVGYYVGMPLKYVSIMSDGRTAGHVSSRRILLVDPRDGLVLMLARR